MKIYEYNSKKTHEYNIRKVKKNPNDVKFEAEKSL